MDTQNLDTVIESAFDSMTSTDTTSNTTSVTIPLNPLSNPVEVTQSRFNGAIWYDKVREQRVLLAGCGGIGSYVGFLLGHLGVKSLTLLDGDTIEAHNLSGQLYFKEDVGKYKVAALYNLIVNTSTTYPYASTHFFSTTCGFKEGIMICGFDNMGARQIYFKAWLDKIRSISPESRSATLFLDGRLAMEEYQIFAITGDNETAIEKYQSQYLFNDEAAEQTQCSQKQTSYMANMVASQMINIFVNFCANQCDPIVPRSVPFLTSFRGDFLDIKTVYYDK